MMVEMKEMTMAVWMVSYWVESKVVMSVSSKGMTTVDE
jgi:hypothetical protein